MSDNETHLAPFQEAAETVEAIRHGKVDAIVVQGPNGPQVVVLQGADEPYRVLVERMSDGAATVDDHGTVMYANSRLATMSGRPIKELVGRNFKSLFAEEAPTLQPDVTVQAHLKGKGDTTLPVAVCASPLQIGDVTATLITLSDQTIHRQAIETANAERFARSILEQATDAIAVLGRDGAILHASAMAEELAGRSVIGEMFMDAFPLQTGREAHAGLLARFSAESMNTLLATKPFHGVEVKLNSERLAHRTFLLSAGPLLNEEKASVGSIVTLTEITDRKRAEEQQTMMVAELNHRVKNILAIVQSVALQTTRNAGSMQAFNDTFSGRIQAIAIAHDILTQTRWIGVGLMNLMEKVLAPYRAEERAISVDGPPILLPARSVMPLSMVIHELATNASKYGALSQVSGSLAIAWSMDGQKAITLTWTERGGPKVGKPKGTGFGTKLIDRVITFDLEGDFKIDYDPAGITCTLKFPLKTDIAPEEVPGSATRPH
ncbi:MAG TPA: HWE histidine kinase domain-containing protein [Pseudolabrys sp.]|nr:HWE histidine kinase domain-containing protein [Pseudolabrys sp.]